MSRRIKSIVFRSVATQSIMELIYAYANNQLNDSSHHQKFISQMMKVDPDRSISKRLIASFNEINPELKNSTRRSFHFEQYKSLSPKNYRKINHQTSRRTFIAMRDGVQLRPPPYFPNTPTFTIKYTGLYCRDDTKDRCRWDEAYVITTAVIIENGETVTRSEAHPIELTNDNSLDTHPDRWLLEPMSALWQGKQQPLNFIDTAMKKNEENAPEIKDKISIIITIAVDYILSRLPDGLESIIEDFLTNVIIELFN